MVDTLRAAKEGVMSPIFRPGDDAAFWDAAQIEYNLPTFAPDDVFLDIGANIGAVSHCAYEHGCRNIWAYEACPENIELARKNVPEGTRLHHLAVVAPFRPKSMPFPVGNNSFFIPDHGPQDVNTTTLDAIVQETGPVRYLKIDVEGSEWEILYTFDRYDLIQEISGEYHEPCKTWYALTQNPDLPPYKWETLAGFLGSHGYQTHFEKPEKDHVRAGAFRAWRG